MYRNTSWEHRKLSTDSGMHIAMCGQKKELTWTFYGVHAPHRLPLTISGTAYAELKAALINIFVLTVDQMIDV